MPLASHQPVMQPLDLARIDVTLEAGIGDVFGGPPAAGERKPGLLDPVSHGGVILAVMGQLAGLRHPVGMVLCRSVEMHLHPHRVEPRRAALRIDRIHDALLEVCSDFDAHWRPSVRPISPRISLLVLTRLPDLVAGARTGSRNRNWPDREFWL